MSLCRESIHQGAIISSERWLVVFEGCFDRTIDFGEKFVSRTKPIALLMTTSKLWELKQRSATSTECLPPPKCNSKRDVGLTRSTERLDQFDHMSNTLFVE